MARIHRCCTIKSVAVAVAKHACVCGACAIIKGEERFTAYTARAGRDSPRRRPHRPDPTVLAPVAPPDWDVALVLAGDFRADRENVRHERALVVSDHLDLDIRRILDQILEAARAVNVGKIRSDRWRSEHSLVRALGDAGDRRECRCADEERAQES
eukprot:2462425-Prymnesium_polylepis.2